MSEQAGDREGDFSEWVSFVSSAVPLSVHLLRRIMSSRLFSSARACCEYFLGITGLGLRDITVLARERALDLLDWFLD